MHMDRNSHKGSKAIQMYPLLIEIYYAMTFLSCHICTGKSVTGHLADFSTWV